MEATLTKTLFERIGGMTAVNAAVDIFYNKVMEDDKISHFFRHIDMKVQSGKLKGFMAYAFGAPMQYSGKSMREAHRHMQLSETHFDAVASHLVSTLHQLNVPQGIIEEVVSIVLSTKNDVLNG